MFRDPTPNIFTVTSTSCRVAEPRNQQRRNGHLAERTLLAFRFRCRLVTLYPYNICLGESQARRNHLCFKYHLPPLLPCFRLVTVVGHLSNCHNLQSLPQCFSGVL